MRVKFYRSKPIPLHSESQIPRVIVYVVKSRYRVAEDTLREKMGTVSVKVLKGIPVLNAHRALKPF